MASNSFSLVIGAWSALRARRNAKRVLALQERQLRRLVRHCYDRVPFYRELYRSAGLGREEIRGLDELDRLPTVDRADLQQLPVREICARGVDPDDLLVRRTSGSSGAPLTIRRFRAEERLLLALKLQVSFDLGLTILSRRVFLIHSTASSSWKQQLYHTPLQNRLRILPVSTLDWRLPKDELVARLVSLRPDVILGAPSILSWVVEALDPADLRRVRPRLVIVEGELCRPEMLRVIEQGFGAPIAERYASHEFVFLGLKPPGETEYGVCGASAIVEVLRDGQPAGPGESGEIVVTGLHSFAMPFVRYRLGDLVERGESANWHPHSAGSLKSILGRSVDRFLLEGGAVVHPYSVANLLRDGEPWLRRFQIVQEERNHFRVRVVPIEIPGPERLRGVTSRLETSFPEAVRVEIEIVDGLTPTQTGKFYPYVAYERFRQWGSRAEPS